MVSISPPRKINETHIRFHCFLKAICIDLFHQRILGEKSTRDQGRRQCERERKDLRRQHDGKHYVAIVR